MPRQPDSKSAPAQMRQDALGGVALIGIALVFILNAGAGSMDWLFPEVLAYSLVAIGVVLIGRAVLGYGERVNVIPSVLRGKGTDVAVFVVLSVVYVALAKPVGFWVMSPIVLFVAAVYLANTRDRRALTQAAVVAVVVSVVAYLLLLQVFFVPLPKAKWWPF